jgi:MFS family permease
VSARSYLMDQPRDPSRPWAPSPFARLARAHALSVCGDAVFTTAMAGLVFFSVTKLDQARWQVAAALLFTIVPFSLAAPFIGPLIDRARGGRKWMIVALCLLRGLVCLLLAWNRDSQLVMYPQFTLVLVFAQGYILARGALVPATVHRDADLVKANSKLAAISGVAAVVGGAVSLIVMWLLSQLDPTDAGAPAGKLGPSAALFLAAVVYLVAAAEAAQLPAVRVAPTPPGEIETEELHAPGIQAASVAMSIVRIVVGFTTFLLAFHFKNLEEADPLGSRVGLVGCVVLAQVGFLLGSAVATRVRRAIVEEQIIVAALAVMGVFGFVTSVMGVLAGAVSLAFAVGLASNSAKQAFDAIVQRDAPDANRGRAFARFETRFQLWWVAGALVPVVVTVPPAAGSLAVGVLGAVGAGWLVVTRGRLRTAVRRDPAADVEPTLVEPRPISRAFLRRRRPVTAPPVDASVLLGPNGLDWEDDEPTVEQAFDDGAVDAGDATLEMAASTDPRLVTRPYPVPGSDAAEPTIHGSLFDGDRTAAWPVSPPPAAPDAPPAGTAGLPWDRPWDHGDGTAAWPVSPPAAAPDASPAGTAGLPWDRPWDLGERTAASGEAPWRGAYGPSGFRPGPGDEPGRIDPARLPPFPPAPGAPAGSAPGTPTPAGTGPGPHTPGTPTSAPGTPGSGGSGPTGTRRTRGPEPLPDDDLAAPSDVAWFHRPDPDAEPENDPGPDPDVEPTDLGGFASDAWSAVAPAPRPPPRPHPRPWDDGPGDPDDAR